MMKRINVNGDIESRQRIAGRKIPSAVQTSISSGQYEKEEKEENEPTDADDQADGAPKARRRKAEGNP